MNKYQEALSSIVFTLHLRVKPKTLGKCEDKNLETLQELVDIYHEYLDLKERATPKKPIIKQLINGSFDWEKEEIINYHVCPNGCKQVRDEYVDKFCSECGQAIDWSENE